MAASAEKRSDNASLSGLNKAAILMLALSEQRVGKIFSLLEDDEIRELSGAMSSLGRVPSEAVERLWVEFAEMIYAGGNVVGNFDSTERILLKVLGKDRVGNIMEEIRGPAGRTMWDKLGNVSEETLASYLKNEYPQTIAVVLSKIKTEHAAKVLTLFPDALASEVLVRMLKMETIQRDVLEDVEKTLRVEFMSNLSRGTTHDAYEMLAEMFNSFDRATETRLMAALEERNAEAAEKVKSLMFTFEDLLKLDAAGIQTLIRTVDKSAYTLALKGANEAIRDLFFSNMSERAAKLLKEDIASLGMVRLRDVDEAQAKMVVTAKDLAMRGEIIIPDNSGEDEMVY